MYKQIIALSGLGTWVQNNPAVAWPAIATVVAAILVAGSNVAITVIKGLFDLKVASMAKGTRAKGGSRRRK